MVSWCRLQTGERLLVIVLMSRAALIPHHIVFSVQPRPKSLGGASSTKLLSLAEAQALNCQVRVSDEPGGDAEESRETDRDGVNQRYKHL